MNDELIALLKRYRLQGGTDGASRKRKRISARHRTRFIALGSVAVALQTTWVLDYDPATRGMLEARRIVEEVSRDQGGKLRFLLAAPLVAFLTTTGANSTTVPQTWNVSDNAVYCYGAGSNGVGTTGGGAGALSIGINVVLTPSTTANYQIPTANSGSDCWFSSTGTVLAKSPASSATGGAAASGVGTTKYSGGNGSGNGGGGSAPSTSANGNSATTTAGAAAPGTGGGAGGTFPGGAGGAGTYWQASPARGPGGGGARGSTGSTGSAGTRTIFKGNLTCSAQPGNGGPGGTGGAGGLYGGGGGGGGAGGSAGSNPGAPCNNASAGSNGSPGAGAQGLIVMMHEPVYGVTYRSYIFG